MTTTTTISDLPRDLAEEILSRIPLKYMRAVRLTCKKWDTLSKNRSFRKIHAAKERDSRMMMLLMDYKLYLMKVVVNTREDPYTEPKGELTCLNNDSEQVEISQIFQCEGFLLCILKDTLRLVVWNPYWGQTRWIEPRYSYHTSFGMDMYRYALGYLGYYEALNPPPREHFSWYEFDDFETGLWKTIDVTSPHWFISKSNRGVSLKGNTYWICAESRESELLKHYMICFDFTRERFGRLLPLPCHVWLGELVTLSCVREEKLTALFQCGADTEAITVEIWITTKIEAEEVLWSKFLTVDMETVDDIPRAVSTFGNFLVDEEKRMAMFFYLESDDYNNVRHSINIIGQMDTSEKWILERTDILNGDPGSWREWIVV